MRGDWAHFGKRKNRPTSYFEIRKIQIISKVSPPYCLTNKLDVFTIYVLWPPAFFYLNSKLKGKPLNIIFTWKFIFSFITTSPWTNWPVITCAKKLKLGKSWKLWTMTILRFLTSRKISLASDNRELAPTKWIYFAWKGFVSCTRQTFFGTIKHNRMNNMYPMYSSYQLFSGIWLHM